MQYETKTNKIQYTQINKNKSTHYTLIICRIDDSS